jgi:hypothetical protein
VEEPPLVELPVPVPEVPDGAVLPALPDAPDGP